MESNRFLVGSYRAELPFSDADIARAAQDLLDEKLVAMLGVLADTHGRELPLILSGGVFANVRSNLELARVGFPKLFIAPPMGDDGLCIGAATAAFDTVGQSRPRRGHARSSRPMSMSVGPTPGVGIDDMLAELDVRYRRPPGDLLASELATALAQGLTVALVHGPQEFGPRALGDRSILAAASDPGINERLNHKLRRTEFMPFAPILRLERVTDVLQIEDIASDVRDCLPFMTICVPVRPWVAQAAPAVVHVDGTARPQAVSREDDPFLHELLSAYEIKTGIPVLINTSFNVHDQPLVSTARDALVGFLAAELDVLCLEGRVIYLASNEHLTRVARLMRRDLEAPLLRARLSGLSESFGAQMVNGPGPFGRQALSTPVAFDNA
jgi:carbamoyltransferase